MTDNIRRLFGSCACQRNLYAIDIPLSSTSLASVFFDNSLQSRRSQASPLAVWLRVPLDFFHSTTIAQFADETHASIRKTFTLHKPRSVTSSIRKQFCGYCGTHLTAYDQAQPTDTATIDVTLGSLLDDSLLELEALNILPDGVMDEQEEPSVPDSSLVKGGSVDDETHIAETAQQEQRSDEVSTLRTPNKQQVVNNMTNRGIPYFEEMIENSLLGRIKRQKGGHVSADGSTSVQWEIVEFEPDEEMDDAPHAAESHVSKRIKIDV